MSGLKVETFGTLQLSGSAETSVMLTAAAHGEHFDGAEAAFVDAMKSVFETVGTEAFCGSVTVGFELDYAALSANQPHADRAGFVNIPLNASIASADKCVHVCVLQESLNTSAFAALTEAGFLTCDRDEWRGFRFKEVAAKAA